MGTFEELAAQSRSESRSHVRMTIHCGSHEIIVLNHKGDLGVAVTLMTHLISFFNHLFQWLTFWLRSLRFAEPI
jgi:hypothetical protein